tara:strand:+ start:9890 stop:10087 length:198 start_codon:yes stop_codon:yes gene_type:complete
MFSNLISNTKDYMQERFAEMFWLIVFFIAIAFLLTYFQSQQEAQLIEAQQTIERIKLKLSLVMEQ